MNNDVFSTKGTGIPYIQLCPRCGKPEHGTIACECIKVDEINSMLGTQTLLTLVYNSLLTAMRDLSTAKSMNHCAEKKALIENVKYEINFSKEWIDSLR
jgi:hypothetical protein